MTDFWADRWGAGDSAPLAAVVEALNTDGLPLARQVLCAALGLDRRDEHVSEAAFRLFERRFGPAPVALGKAHASLTEAGALVPWFHGAISRTAAATALTDVGPGGFLVRYSGDHPQHFTLTYIGEDGKARNSLMCNAGERGFALGHSAGPDDATFASLRVFVSRNRSKLARPCVCTRWQAAEEEAHPHPHPAGVAREDSDATYGELSAGAMRRQDSEDSYGELGAGAFQRQASEAGYGELGADAFQRQDSESGYGELGAGELGRQDSETGYGELGAGELGAGRTVPRAQQPPPAAAHLQTAVQLILSSDFAAAIAELEQCPEGDREAAEQLAACRERLGDHAAAAADYERCRALLLGERARLLAAEDDVPAALDVHLRAVSWKLARCLVAVERAPDAVQHFATALGLATEDADRSVILDELRELREVGALPPLQPREAEHVFGLAVEAFKAKRFADAERQFGDAVLCARLADDRVLEGRALANLGSALTKQGDARAPEAVDRYLRCLDITSRLNDPAKMRVILKNLYLACKAARRFRAARRFCERLLHLTEDEAALRHLREVMRELGRQAISGS